ncbi:MAG: right-handed parallel beta-helix repeat-containing protein [Thermomicrobiales bacterium]
MTSARRLRRTPLGAALALTLLLTLSQGSAPLRAAPAPTSPSAPVSIAATPRTYYVDANAASGGSGSVSAPWRLIQQAAAVTAPGDTVLIAPGSYVGPVTIDRSGSAGSPVTFRATGPGVVVEGSGAGRDAIFVTYADYDTLDGVGVRHATRAGVRVDSSAHVTIERGTFADNGVWGIFTDVSDDLLIQGNDVSGSVEQHGIYTSNSGDRPVVRGNTIHGNHAAGLHMNADLSQGGDGVISGALVADNVIYDNGVARGAAINMDGVEYSVVRNNLLYGNHASGIAVFQQDGAICSRNNSILNNTIVMATDSRWAVTINAPDPSACTGNILADNILFTAHSWRGSISLGGGMTGFASDHNVVMDRFSVDDGDTRLGLAGWRALGHDAASIIATPAQLFIDSGNGDFHLKPGSPAIDAGATLTGVTDDLDGIARPRGSAYDIGAYESGSAGPSPTSTPTGTPTRTPPTSPPTKQPTPKAMVTATAAMTAPPTATKAPTTTPAKTPTANPTAPATVAPTRTPTTTPTKEATRQPTPTKTPSPVSTPKTTRTPVPAQTATPVPAPSPYPIIRSGRTSNSVGSNLAYDGNAGTYWITKPGALPPSRAYFYVDLGAVKPISAIRWSFAVEGLADGMQIQV